MKTSRLLAIPLALSLTGCYEDFTPDIDTTPVLCLNALVPAGDTITTEARPTHLFTSNIPIDYFRPKGLRVTITANGDTVPSGYRPSPSDRITIHAVTDNYGEASAEVIVPQQPHAECTRWSVTDVTPHTYPVLDEEWVSVMFDIRADITVSDTEPTDNYYRIGYSAVSGITRPPYNPDDPWETPPYNSLNCGSLNTDLEPIFGEHIGVFETVTGATPYGFTFFTDKRFMQSDYTLHLHFQQCHYNAPLSSLTDPDEPCALRIELSGVSSSYYKWGNYLWQIDEGPLGDMGDIGFGEPMAGYSNVSTGAGVVAASTTLVTDIDLRGTLLDIVSGIRTGE